MAMWGGSFLRFVSRWPALFRRQFAYPTPRATNNPAVPPVTVFINEWMAANTSFLADPADGDYDDWFELYNPTTKSSISAVTR